MQTESIFTNSRGQSLIQILISVALMGIIATGFASMMNWQNHTMSQTTNKLAAMDLERLMTSVLGDGATCAAILNGKQVDPNNLPGVGVPLVANIPSIPYSTAPGALLAVEAGTTASPLSRTLMVASIDLVDVKCATACATTTSKYNGNLRISFAYDKNYIPVAPLNFPITFSTPGNTGTQAITGCNGTSANPLGLGGTQANPTCNGTPLPPPQNPYVPLTPAQKRILAANHQAYPPDPTTYQSQLVNGKPHCVYPDSYSSPTQALTVTIFNQNAGGGGGRNGGAAQVLPVGGSVATPGGQLIPGHVGSWGCSLDGWICQ